MASKSRGRPGVLASSSKLGGKPLQFHELEEPFLDRQLEILAKQSSINITLVGFDDRIRRQVGPGAPCPTALTLLAHPLPRVACRTPARHSCNINTAVT